MSISYVSRYSTLSRYTGAHKTSRRPRHGRFPRHGGHGFAAAGFIASPTHDIVRRPGELDCDSARVVVLDEHDVAPRPSPQSRTTAPCSRGPSAFAPAASRGRPSHSPAPPPLSRPPASGYAYFHHEDRRYSRSRASASPRDAAPRRGAGHARRTPRTTLVLAPPGSARRIGAPRGVEGEALSRRASRRKPMTAGP